MYVSAPCECLQMPEESVDSTRIEVTDDCELLCGCWTLDPISGRAASATNHWTIFPGLWTCFYEEEFCFLRNLQ